MAISQTESLFTHIPSLHYPSPRTVAQPPVLHAHTFLSPTYSQQHCQTGIPCVRIPKTSPRNLLEMQILRPHPRLSKSGLLSVTQKSMAQQSLQVIVMHLQYRNRGDSWGKKKKITPASNPPSRTLTFCVRHPETIASRLCRENFVGTCKAVTSLPGSLKLFELCRVWGSFPASVHEPSCPRSRDNNTPSRERG